MDNSGQGSLTYSTNHLLFMDDLKIFSKKEDTLIKMMNDVNLFSEAAGLEKNVEKSATNVQCLSSEAKLLDGLDSYRYLGVLEDKMSNILKSDVLKSIFDEMKKRINNLATTKLNSGNLFKSINEHALSLYNYYIGLIDIDPTEFEVIDKKIRGILIQNKIHLKPANKERLYLPRNCLGEGSYL
ncbi:uncharacterized protein LOC115230137 [Octopus sinensis]|uniref:Uncharacterized protein LOC115230137 n=1 Tax=Octopus sinensis TaxID=2607531 RepID=A0A6P7U3W2_9MOLL|nr:uncharacterized protein LOC115230137 [Octopus sinensis]